MMIMTVCSLWNQQSQHIEHILTWVYVPFIDTPANIVVFHCHPCTYMYMYIYVYRLTEYEI